MYVTSVGTGAVYRGTTLVSDAEACSCPRAATAVPRRPASTWTAGAGSSSPARVRRSSSCTTPAANCSSSGRPRPARSSTTSRSRATLSTSPTRRTTRSGGRRLTRDGLGELKPWLTRDRIQPIPYFLNGIVTDGRALLVGEQGQDVTYRIDLRTRQVTVLEVPERHPLRRRYLLEGRRLYAVYNAGGGKYVTRLALLNHDLTKATLVADSSPGRPVPLRRRSPATAAGCCGSNSQLDVAPGHPAVHVSVVPGFVRGRRRRGRGLRRP